MLKKVFGDDLTVFLDLFHATQRPITAVGRKCLTLQQHAKFSKDVSDVFRYDNDKKLTTRKMPTPSIAEITKNLILL